MARTKVPDSVPLGPALIDHPFTFRGHAYRTIALAFEAGAQQPPVIPADELARSWAHQDAAHAELLRQRAEREAARVAVVTRETERKEADKEAKRRHDEAIAYVASYSGTWGLPLDIRTPPPAGRWGTKYLRLSEKQVEALLAGKARDAARAEAAQIDRELFAADQYEAHNARPQNQQAPRLAPQPATRQALGSVEPGMYRTPDGTIWKVQLAVHGSGKPYAKRLVVEPGQPGTFVYEPGAITRLRADHRMTLDDAKAFGALYGVCCQCGRTLTDEGSIADGIGPVCAGRL